MKTLNRLKKLTKKDFDESTECDIKSFFGTAISSGILDDFGSISKILKNMLPKFQDLTVFDSNQVAKLSKFIDEYEKFKSDIISDFKNRVSPEDWNAKT